MRLRRSDVNGPGCRRRRAGRGFAYYDIDGSLIRDERLDREGRTGLARACFDFLPHRALLDLAGWDEQDIFAHV